MGLDGEPDGSKEKSSKSTGEVTLRDSRRSGIRRVGEPCCGCGCDSQDSWPLKLSGRCTCGTVIGQLRSKVLAGEGA